MKFLRKARSIFHDDWCSKCYEPMDVYKKELYMLPMMVGHYVSHTNPNYYKKNLIKVNSKKEIPVGTYACGIYVYKCPACSHKATKLSIFLPVRDVEKSEDAFLFENGEMDDFI